MGKKVKKKKSKGKKAKKGKQKTASVDPSSAMPDCRILETRLTALQSTKDQYRVAAQKLLRENETLEQQYERSEKDTMQVVSFLKDEDMKKDQKIASLQQIIEEMKNGFEVEKKYLVDDYTQQIYKLHEVLMEKTDEVKLMQAELKLVKEFRKKRAVMQKELDEIKDTLYVTEKKQKEDLSYMEKKFLEEKVRLQKEANFKIAELAQHAHSEAVSNLNDTTRDVYKENIRLNDTLGYHLDEGEQLKKIKGKLESKNKDLVEEKELNGLLVQDKVIENQGLKSRIRQMDAKMESLENMVANMSKTMQQKQPITSTQAAASFERERIAGQKLQRLLDMKTKECSRIKFLAKRILDERSEVEQFLLDSLQIVKCEIAESRKQYRKDAEAAYTIKMLDAQRGRGDYPRIRTFNDLTTSTNDVHADMADAAAVQLAPTNDAGDDSDGTSRLHNRFALADLTWEQREKVLRTLFAKINATQQQQNNLLAVAGAEFSQKHDIATSSDD